MTKYLVFWTNYFYFVPQAAKAPTNERENKSIKTLINKKTHSVPINISQFKNHI